LRKKCAIATFSAICSSHPNEEKLMNRTTKFSVAMLALGVALALSPALRAQETPQAPGAQTPGTQEHGGMMGNDMQGMMKMMGQMSQMMDQCSRMMQGKTERQGAPTPDQR